MSRNIMSQNRGRDPDTHGSLSLAQVSILIPSTKLCLSIVIGAWDMGHGALDIVKSMCEACYTRPDADERRHRIDSILQG